MSRGLTWQTGVWVALLGQCSGQIISRQYMPPSFALPSRQALNTGLPRGQKHLVPAPTPKDQVV